MKSLVIVTRRKQETPQTPDDLALRVQQLENIIRSTQAMSTNASVPPVQTESFGSVMDTEPLQRLQRAREQHHSSGSQPSTSSNNGTGRRDRTSPVAKQTAVEEAAAAALGELSKATVDEVTTQICKAYLTCLTCQRLLC